MKQITKGGLALLLFGLTISSWSQQAVIGWEKVVFHLDDSTNARWSLLLANAFLDDSPQAKLVFVAYGPGIDFLLEDAEDRHGEPYDPAVLSLTEK